MLLEHFGSEELDDYGSVFSLILRRKCLIFIFLIYKSKQMHKLEAGWIQPST